MKVLITGAAALNWLSFVIAILERGDEVIGIGNHNHNAFCSPALKEASHPSLINSNRSSVSL